MVNRCGLSWIVRGLARASFLVALLAVTGGGCTFGFSSSHGDDCDEDDDCNKPLAIQAEDPASVTGDALTDDPFVAPQLPASAYRLTHYELESSDEMDRHPVRRLIDIEGSSLQEVWGPGPWGEGALRAFVEAVRDANAELIGLPPAAGWLKQRGVTIAGRHVLVDYEQRQDGAGAGAPALDAQLIFVFDLTGRLIWIENDTILPAWVTPNRRLRER